MASKADIAIGYLAGASVDSAFCQSLAAMLVRDRFKRIDGVITIESGPHIIEGRNKLAEQFMATNCNWLLMLDADMSFPADLHTRLLRHATPNRVVGGLCYAYGARLRKAEPVMFSPQDGARIWGWEEDSLVPAIVGGACLMIHRNILMNIKYPWFVNMASGQMDQDQVFCARVFESGASVAVDTSTVIGHCKRLIVDERDYVNPGVGVVN